LQYISYYLFFLNLLFNIHFLLYYINCHIISSVISQTISIFYHPILSPLTRFFTSHNYLPYQIHKHFPKSTCKHLLYSSHSSILLLFPCISQILYTILILKTPFYPHLYMRKVMFSRIISS
jgi:hypothetical protein